MRALIMLENRFIKDNQGNIWCDRIIDYNFLKRYLEVFEEITVCGRFKKVDRVSNKLLVNGDGVSFIELPNFTGAYGTIKEYRNVRKIVKKNLKDIDCAILRGPSHLSLITYDIFMKNNKKFAVEFVMAANKMFEGKGLINKVLNNIVDNKAKKMCMKANGVAYVTERILQDKYPCKAMKLENTEYFTTNYSTIDLDEGMFYKQKWKVENKPDIFEIIHTGYMDSYRKGQGILIKAIKEVRDSGLNVELNLIGDGKKRTEFEQLTKKLEINEFVNFLGLINDKNILFENLRKSHILVLPTQSEGLPRSIIEAMAVGLPCIASPVDGIPELLDSSFLIECEDYSEYAKKIIELINNWENMIQISKKNYKTAKKYSKENLDKKRHDFYTNLKNIS